MMRNALLIIALGLGACGGAQKDRENLAESVRNFNEGIRWQRYAVAATNLPPKQRGTFVDEMDERSEDLRITDYEVIRVDNDGARAAKVHVKIAWYLDSVGTLRETHALQSWEQHGKEWWMVDEVRLRGDEMPGLTETAIEKTPEAASADVAPKGSDSGANAPATPM